MIAATSHPSGSQMARIVSKIPWLLMTLLAFQSARGAYAEAEKTIQLSQPECALSGAIGCSRSTVKLKVGPGAAGQLSRLELVRGRATLLETPFAVTRVAVGDPEIADVVVIDPRQINIVPLQVGETNLLLWGAGSKLGAAVDLEVGNSHFRLERELRRVLENETIELEGSRDSIVLKGTVDGPVQMKHALAVTHALMGSAGKDGVSDQEHAETSRLVNLLKIGGNQQVMIEVIVAEMDRNLRRRLGTNLAGVYRSGGTDVNILSLLQGLTRLEGSTALNNVPQILEVTSRVNFISTIVKGSDNLSVFIEAVQADGLIKILAEPNLVARSGESAEFLVGGEVPIPIPQSGTFGTITIEFKQFGVGINFTPTVLSSDRIYMDVSTEVSEPNLALGIELGGLTVPAFNTRRVATGIELRDGESFAIAGLLRDDVTEVISEFPGLGDIPVLGALFRSTEFERKQTELVIIATPRLVVPLSGGRPALPTDHFFVPSALEFFFLGSMEATSRGGRGGGAESLTDEASRSGEAPAEVERALELPFVPMRTPDGGLVSGVSDSFAGAVGHALDLDGAEGELR